MPDALRLTLLAAAPVCIAWLGSSAGLLPAGSKYLGAAWAFCVILAYRYTTLRAWWVLLAFTLALSADHLIVRHAFASGLVDSDLDPNIAAIVGTLMMGAACGLGFLVGHSTRKSRSSQPGP